MQTDMLFNFLFETFVSRVDYQRLNIECKSLESCCCLFVFAEFTDF